QRPWLLEMVTAKAHASARMATPKRIARFVLVRVSSIVSIAVARGYGRSSILSLGLAMHKQRCARGCEGNRGVGGVIRGPHRSAANRCHSGVGLLRHEEPPGSRANRAFTAPRGEHEPAPGHEEGDGDSAIAVGTSVAGGPPHRSQRAGLPHWAPTLGQTRSLSDG